MQPAGILAHPREDTLAGIVVFLVALPLCVGIAAACGVPPVSGLVAGIVGGMVVPLFSRSPLSVSGPAAGMVAIVLLETTRLGGMRAFLVAVVLAGVLQMAMGVLRTGKYAALVPSSVVKGMLAAIGITIVVKELPALVGAQGGVGSMLAQWHPGAAAIGLGSLVLLRVWHRLPFGRSRLLPPALAIVVLGGLAGWLLEGARWGLGPAQLVHVPVGGFDGLHAELSSPDWSVLQSPPVWGAAATIAVVASIETLLSCQAVDRLDPLRRRTPPDRELIAQGIGNAATGLLGGLPITSVIVRGGANAAAGARGRLSAIVHGFLLLGFVVFFPETLNHIPQACLAAVLIQVGLGLAHPTLFIEKSKRGLDQLAVFVATIAGVLATDMLIGVLIGVGVAIAVAVRRATKASIERIDHGDGSVTLRLRRATFLVKPALLEALARVPAGSTVTIDTSGEHVDHDVREALGVFLFEAPNRDITVRLVGIELAGVAASAH